MLKARLVTGPLLIALLLAVVWLDAWLPSDLLGSEVRLPAGLGLLALCLIATAAAGRELCAIASAAGRDSSPLLVVGGSWALLISTWGVAGGITAPAWPLLVLVATWFAAVCDGVRGQLITNVPANASATVTMTLYLGGLLGFYLFLRQDVSAWWIAAVVLITKSCDIGAYFTGMSVGRRKLIPWLSPGKTIEGFIGGIVMAMAVAVLLSWWLAAEGFREIELGRALILGAALAVFGQAGDLCMSLIKRDAGVKDSAASLPGMGGVMDVLDSPLLAAPVAWLVLTV